MQNLINLENLIKNRDYMTKRNWVQVNLPTLLVKKIDELIEKEWIIYANRNQFCASVLINAVESVIDRNLKLKE